MLGKLFGSQLRARIIGWLFIHSDERYYVRQLADILGEDSTNLSRELKRLEELGVVTCQRDGKQKYYQASRDLPIFDELRSIAVKTLGLGDILRNALVPYGNKIRLAFVHGSVAQGTHTAKSDIDLVIVANLDPVELHRTIAQVEDRLKRTVNYSLFSPEEFESEKDDADSFVSSVLSGPILIIVGEMNEPTATA
jgi:DNA-binding transcriptional ArsR family regulator